MLSSVEEINMFKILKNILIKSDAENKSLSDEYLEIVRKFGELGIEIEDINEVNITVWKRIYLCIDNLYRNYPELPKGFFNRLNFKEENSIACTAFCLKENNLYDTTNVFVSLNKFYFLDTNNFKIKKAATNIDIALEDYIEFSICHEFGHILDIYFSLRYDSLGFRENVPENEIIDFLNTIPLSNKLVEQAIIAYINNIGKSHKETLLSEKMGYTASKDNAEAFAESIAFHYFTKNNLITNYIIEEYRRSIEER